MLKYSISQKTFHDMNLNYSDLPEDLIDIDQETYEKIVQRSGDEEFDYQDGKFIIYSKNTLNEEDFISNEKLKLTYDIENRFSNIIRITTNNPNQEEKETWNLKLSIANNYLNNNTSELDGLFFKGANLISEQSKKEWCEKVIKKAQYYSTILGNVEALRASLKAKLKTTNSIKDLEKLRLLIKNEYNTLLEMLKELV